MLHLQPGTALVRSIPFVLLKLIKLLQSASQELDVKHLARGACECSCDGQALTACNIALPR